MGWTSWQIESCRLLGQTEEAVTVSVRLRNTGARVGADVVQAYLRSPDDGWGRPAIWLAGHARVEAGPGETTETAVAIPRRAFEVWSPTGWVLPKGNYRIAIGHNALDLPMEIEVVWT